MFSTSFVQKRFKSSYKLLKSLKRQEGLAQQAVTEQFVNHIMKDGLKQRARRIIKDSLDYLKIHANELSQNDIEMGPTTAETRQVVPSTINATELFQDAVDRIAPLVKVKTSKINGKNQLIPRPLTSRQSRRIGISWLSEQASKKKGDLSFGKRIGMEMILVLKGKSLLFQKKENVHKQALANRSNLVLVDRKI